VLTEPFSVYCYADDVCYSCGMKYTYMMTYVVNQRIHSECASVGANIKTH